MRKEAGRQWYHSMLFSLKFSNKSIQFSSDERLKTVQRTLCLSLEINNCFQIAV
jgi:hypothetical protein